MSDPDFVIIAEYHKNEVASEVTRYLADGYTLHGPLQVHCRGSGHGDMFYVQAMVLLPVAEPKPKPRAKPKAPPKLPASWPKEDE